LNFTTLHQQIALTFLSGIGSRRARILVAHFNNLEAFFSEKRLNLAKIPGIPPNFVSFKQRVQALVEADKIVEQLTKSGTSTVFFTDSDYPRRLKQCEDAPLLLYTQGNINWNPERVVSIVGTRHASDYGKQLTKELVDALKTVDATVVSGMAYGIDICAHHAALQADLPTWGVLGHGFDFMYPSGHRKTAKRMLEKGGLVSEFIPMQKPEPAHFPMRNRIVAGLADATIVIESGESGGSLITANLANDYNRDVFAFPGDITRPYSKGCNQLIKNNKAHLLSDPSDLLEHMNWLHQPSKIATQKQLFVELNAKEEQIITILREKKDLSIDVIAHLSSSPISLISSELLGLEFKGLVRSMPGRRFTLA
jgi:DNA processing protein